MRLLLLFFLITASNPAPSIAKMYCSRVLGSKIKILSLSKSMFPKKYNVDKSDPHLRQAIFEIFNEKNFYNQAKVLKHEMEIDHVWPQDHGGPDNIANYVLADKETNNQKSNHMDKEITVLRLERVRNDFAERAYLRYLQLKRGTKAKKKIPLQKIDRVEEIINRSELSQTYRLWAFDLITLNYNGKIADLENFTIKFIEILKQIKNISKKDEMKTLLVNFQELINFSKKISSKTMYKKITSFIIEQSWLAGHMVKIIQLANREKSKFKNFSEFLNSTEQLIQILEQSAYSEENRWKKFFKVVTRKQFNQDQQLVTDTFAAIIKHSNLKSDKEISITDYLNGLNLLSTSFSPKELKNLIQILRDHKRLKKMSSFRQSVRRILDLKLKNPDWSFLKIKNALFR